jgi:asparagine synthase (glutamine-hydrolysing)
MCGIFGVIDHDSDALPEPERLRQTAQLLRHRGPDACGCFSEPGVGLVHTRLALLDLDERSNQPFWDASGRYALVYNGEIYNFAELREDLERVGAQFRTTSDTEVVLEALLRWGIRETLPRLEGMFAFALYDKVDKTVVLARDRFGIKPLFVYETPGRFVFSSEIRAMQPWVRLEPDVLSISGYLYGFSGPTKGFTLFKHVRIIEPGGMVTVHKGGAVERSRFFSLDQFVDFHEMDELARASTRSVIDRVDELLNESVKAQLVADAPVGALCSGGLDSSVIMAIAARYHSNLAIFHANVVGPVSEFPQAARLAEHLKLDLKAVEVHDHDFIDSMPEVTRHFGHPFYSCPHSVPYLAVSKLVRQNGVKAVLSGEAADEYFLGYSFCAPDLRQYLRPGPMLRLLAGWIRGAAAPDPMRYRGPSYVQGGDGTTMDGLVAALHNRFETVNETIDIRARIGEDVTSARYKGVLPSLDLLGYNLRALLHRNDSMGMAASIEARFPLLDSRLAKVAINLPYNYKVRFDFGARDKAHYFFRDKWIMRKLAERYLPSSLFRQDKKPFPINAYAGQRMHIDPAYFDDSFISDLFELGLNERRRFLDRAPHWLKWKMLSLDVWARVSLATMPSDTVLEKLHQHVSLKNAEYAGYLQ